MGRRIARACITAAVLLAVGCASTSPIFGIDWEVRQRASGPVVRGQVTNHHAIAAREIRLLLEGLDASGEVVSTTVGYLPSIIPSGRRMPFEIPVPEDRTTVTYKVRVMSYDLVLPPGGSGRRDR